MVLWVTGLPEAMLAPCHTTGSRIHCLSDTSCRRSDCYTVAVS